MSRHKPSAFFFCFPSSVSLFPRRAYVYIWRRVSPLCSAFNRLSCLRKLYTKEQRGRLESKQVLYRSKQRSHSALCASDSFSSFLFIGWVRGQLPSRFRETCPKKETISFRKQPVLTTKMLAEMVIFMEKQQQGKNANGGKLSLGKFLLYLPYACTSCLMLA